MTRELQNEKTPLSNRNISLSLVENIEERKLFNTEQYKELKSEIQESREHLLSLTDNWDDEDDKSFKMETWKFTAEFLIELFYKFNESHAFYLEMPNILPVGDLSIDIHWKTDNMELTINFSPDFIDHPSFYGRDKNDNEIQGIMEIDKVFLVIFPWLKNFH